MSDKPTAVRVYLARVRTALADLPASEIEEILEDVRPHLAELEAELGEGARVEALIERLGTPESYAAELRASGGYPPEAEGATQVLATTAKVPSLAKPRIAFWGLVLCAVALALFAFGSAVGLEPSVLLGAVLFLPVFLVSLFLLLRGGVEPVLALPEVVWLRQALAKGREQEDSGKAMSYLASLKPAWWILCAVVLVAFGLLLMLRSRSAVLLLPFLLVAGGAAVWAGPRLRGDRRLLWVAVPISAFVIGGILGGFGAAVDLISTRNSYPTPARTYFPTSDQYGNAELSYGGRRDRERLRVRRRRQAADRGLPLRRRGQAAHTDPLRLRAVERHEGEDRRGQPVPAAEDRAGRHRRPGQLQRLQRVPLGLPRERGRAVQRGDPEGHGAADDHRADVFVRTGHADADEVTGERTPGAGSGPSRRSPDANVRETSRERGRAELGPCHSRRSGRTPSPRAHASSTGTSAPTGWPGAGRPCCSCTASATTRRRGWSCWPRSRPTTR